MQRRPHQVAGHTTAVCGLRRLQVTQLTKHQNVRVQADGVLDAVLPSLPGAQGGLVRLQWIFGRILQSEDVARTFGLIMEQVQVDLQTLRLTGTGGTGDQVDAIGQAAKTAQSATARSPAP